ncbi:uncharacterized protein LOC110226271 [Arabidopsis lyrata subsp. lyrata]|uniref:uncharacterized protein LOC110226271 n=1 Tax=Arabidopsis lyrata subsp. lyrata TaxID=81972 RepID=UPI000A29C73D|nr:uncharacterized protein LOC110226271 [Arabidopsis lyrata subsp. lyrata]|eukprot:XP_020872945.1 uncharacterized protein LOC110226271 [Arabidopsis lyrata subsp. lyrata]
MDSSSFPNQDTNVDANNMESPASVNKGKRKGNTNTNEATSKPPPKVQKKNTEIPTGSRSPVWEHFTKTEKDIKKCDCNYCGKRMSCLATFGTSNLHTHLGTCKEYKAWNEKEQQNLDQDGGSGNLTLGKVSKEVYREATNEMLVLAQLPLSFVECIAWRHFCRKCKLYEPHSRRTATRDIVEFFVKKREALKKMFKSTKQRVSLTTDIWTANVTGASYMVITAHFIDSN